MLLQVPFERGLEAEMPGEPGAPGCVTIGVGTDEADHEARGHGVAVHDVDHCPAPAEPLPRDEGVGWLTWGGWVPTGLGPLLRYQSLALRGGLSAPALSGVRKACPCTYWARPPGRISFEMPPMA